MNSAPNCRTHRLRIVLSYGFRPFFLAAALWGATAIGLWIAVLTTGLSIPTRFDLLTWHIHEMFFGFVLAAVAGFLPALRLSSVTTGIAAREAKSAAAAPEGGADRHRTALAALRVARFKPIGVLTT